MNLLIIDDQTSVVSGLMRGVMWKSIGIDEVLCAYNAYEAKKIFGEKTIDIMLCDIEMPVENGLSLLKWVRSQGYDTECIFLTAHAEFDYAREAISMGSFDYVVQPAPYAEVEAVVARAVCKVVERQAEKETYDFGKYMKDKKDLLMNRTLGEWLGNNMERRQYEDFARMEDLPLLNQCGYLVLMQINRQMLPIDQWEPSLMRFTFENVLNEIFAPYDQRVLLCNMDKMLYGLIIYGPNGYDMDYAGVLRQLQLTRESFAQYLKCEASFYANGQHSILVRDMPENMEGLLKACRENVSMRCAIFDLSTQSQEGSIDDNYMQLQLRRWNDYIVEGLFDSVIEDADSYLDRMDSDGRLNRAGLMHFHMGFCQMLYQAGESIGKDMHHIIEQQQWADLYTKAPQSMQDMKVFVSRTINILRTDESDEYQQRNQIRQIENYIHDHIENEIHRDDIAAYVHLNVDYMGRLFKKNKGMSLKEYVIEEKMRMAQNLLKTTMLPVSFVASKVGYSNFSHFSRTYKKVIGISPKDERRSENE